MTIPIASSSTTTNEFGRLTRIWSAVLYGSCSFTIVFANKYVLTTLGFPSFLIFALFQLICTVVCLSLASAFSLVQIPRFNSSIPKKIFPLPLFFLVGLITGLGGTQRLSLPMFTALRHTTIFLTLLLECAVFGSYPSIGVKISVVLIIGAFDVEGYALIFVNNFATALNGICLKQKLDSNELGTYGLLFYNAFFMIPIAIVIILFTNDLEKVTFFFTSSDVRFYALAVMISTFFFGLLLNYSMLRCTEVNSALTTTIVGAIKNTAITYIGMLASGDYVFQIFNFFGVTLTVFGSALYIVVVFGSKPTNEYKLVAVESKD
ncbi:TPT domain-containing protein [Aphelenchoides besseyi]|nr:TPT domain-containing protein [Aphelenchoides besseyi]